MDKQTSADCLNFGIETSSLTFTRDRRRSTTDSPVRHSWIIQDNFSSAPLVGTTQRVKINAQYHPPLLHYLPPPCYARGRESARSLKLLRRAYQTDHYAPRIYLIIHLISYSSIVDIKGLIARSTLVRSGHVEDTFHSGLMSCFIFLIFVFSLERVFLRYMLSCIRELGNPELVVVTCH